MKKSKNLLLAVPVPLPLPTNSNDIFCLPVSNKQATTSNPSNAHTNSKADFKEIKCSSCDGTDHSRRSSKKCKYYSGSLKSTKKKSSTNVPLLAMNATL